MKKMLKIMAMLLIVATVVFAAGCSSKPEENKSSVASENITQSTSAATVAPENITTDTTDENITVENLTEENETEVVEGLNESEVNLTADSAGIDSENGSFVPTEEDDASVNETTN